MKIYKRLLTEKEGDHDFFSKEMCEDMILNGVTDEQLSYYLMGADIRETPKRLRDARIIAYETMIEYLKDRCNMTWKGGMKWEW
jgi:transcription initiation factor IIE alpha subunit